MQPEKFYGIDIFSESVKGFWNDDIFEKQGMTHLQWYKNRFRNEIEEGKFEVKQGLSWDVLAEFPDNYFDYAYLDAGHSYENVARDVAILRQKIKEGGNSLARDRLLENICEAELKNLLHHAGICEMELPNWRVLPLLCMEPKDWFNIGLFRGSTTPPDRFMSF